MNIKKLVVALVCAAASMTASSQIMLSPVIDSAIDGLTDNNKTILEGRLRNVISSNGMVSGYGTRFVLACKVAALQREVSGTKLIQHLEVSFAIGDNIANACFGSCSVECFGIGNTEGQAMTSAFRNIKGNNKELRKIVAEAHDRIVSYYEQNGPAIIKKAQNLVTAQKWEEALYELTAIPEECSCYPLALEMINKVYDANLNHDSAQMLAQAQAAWAADPNPGPGADEATELLAQVDPSSSSYSKAQTLLKQIQTRTQQVAEREAAAEAAQAKHERDMEKSRLAAATAIEKTRINACRDIAVAYAKRNVTVVNHFHSWW